MRRPFRQLAFASTADIRESIELADGQTVVTVPRKPSPPSQTVTAAQAVKTQSESETAV